MEEDYNINTRIHKQYVDLYKKKLSSMDKYNNCTVIKKDKKKKEWIIEDGLSKTLKQKCEKWFTQEEIKKIEMINKKSTVPSSFTKSKLRTLISLNDVLLYSGESLFYLYKMINNNMNVKCFIKPNIRYYQIEETLKILLIIKKRGKKYG